MAVINISLNTRLKHATLTTNFTTANKLNCF